MSFNYIHKSCNFGEFDNQSSKKFVYKYDRFGMVQCHRGIIFISTSEWKDYYFGFLYILLHQLYAHFTRFR